MQQLVVLPYFYNPNETVWHQFLKIIFGLFLYYLILLFEIILV